MNYGRYLCLAFLAVPCLIDSGYGQWISLIDEGLTQWTQSNGQPPGDGWVVQTDTVRLERSRGRGGNLVTRQEFGDFELVFDYKISTKGNSGIKYRVQDFDGRTLGCEYQVVDDQGLTNLRPKQKTASLYDVFAPDYRHPPAAEQWHQAVIQVKNNRIQHWLDGYLVMTVCVGSDRWKEHIAESKFSDVEGFGENRYGRLMLTDHNSDVAYRNMFIRSLDPPQYAAGRCPPTRGRLLGRLLRRR